MENEARANTKYLFAALRGGAVFGIFFLIKSLILFFTTAIATDPETQIYADFPLWSIGLVVVIGGLLAYNSLARHFSLYDKEGLDEFLLSATVGGRLHEYSVAIRRADILIETGIPVILTAVFIPFGLFKEGELLFSFAGDLSHILTFTVFALSFVFSGVNSRYETLRHWERLHKTRELDTALRRWKFLVKLGVIFLIYPFAIPLSPVVFFVVYNAFSVLYFVLGLFSTVGLLLLLLFAAFLLFVLPKLRAISKRHAFIKRLHAVAERSGCEITAVRSERSLRLGACGSLTFDLKQGETLYSCRLIVIEKKNLPLYFTSAETAHFLYKIGGKKHFVSLARHFSYGTVGEGKPILILTPEPKYVFISSDGGERRLFTGDRMWNYTVYESDSFFGAIDRRCLGRATGMFE